MAGDPSSTSQQSSPPAAGADTLKAPPSQTIAADTTPATTATTATASTTPVTTTIATTPAVAAAKSTLNPSSTSPPGAFDAGSPSDAIEADDGLDDPDHDADDGYESEGVSDATTSISSSIRDFTWENNRRYHKYKEGRYSFPNDEPEQEREDMRHAMVLHLCGGKLHFAPLENPQNILDVGTGTGIWAIDMGDEYPSAEVTGIDLSPIQPDWVPPNVRFIIDDGEAPWLTPPGTLDYVHFRNMAFVIKDWPKMFAQAFTALKPGGWIELQDLKFNYSCDDGSMPDDYGPAKMAELIHEALARFGVDTHSADRNPQRAEAAGFVDLRHSVIKLPVGPWARDKTMKTVGLYNRSGIYDGLHAITMGPLTRGLKWSAEEVEVFLTGVRKDLMDTRIHSYITWHSICAQKPLSAPR